MSFGIKQKDIGRVKIELIKACVKNSRQAQEELYRYFFPKLLPMIKRYTRDEDEILSIYNDGMLRVFTKIKLYSFTGNFEAWVKKIVFNSLSNYFRKRNTEKNHQQLEHIHPKSSANILSGMYYNDLVKLLDVIPQKSSRIFKMYTLEGFSHKEISEKLGISVGTSKWHVFKAKEELMNSIESNKDSYE